MIETAEPFHETLDVGTLTLKTGFSAKGACGTSDRVTPLQHFGMIMLWEGEKILLVLFESHAVECECEKGEASNVCAIERLSLEILIVRNVEAMSVAD